MLKAEFLENLRKITPEEEEILKGQASILRILRVTPKQTLVS
ncbi:MAG: hypothetical protein U0K93_07510 [Acutalibacteraceae bacterium]|nr:hypothetical protein [Acutalibacteraceae bacterium]